MLKLKDNIDLKDLEKYGFIKRKDLIYRPSYKDKDIILIKLEENRILNCRGLLERDDKLDTLYDLIKDDLVEKILY